MSHSAERYSRQFRFDKIGPDGQERLAAGRAAVIGCGALGSGVVHNLARAGVGHIRIVDREVLSTSQTTRTASSQGVLATWHNQARTAPRL